MSVTPIASKASQDISQLEQVLIKGDLSVLNEGQRLHYYKAVCDSVGLNYLTKPFDYITLNQKLVLYAKRDATDQLRKIHSVSIKISSRETIDGVYVVTAQAKMPSGREDESTGAVHTTGLKGDVLANAYMKAETKAKRRVTLSICGLGMLDETEVADIPAKEKNPIFSEQPGLEDGVPDHSYRAPFGKYRGRTVEQIANEFGIEAMRSYVNYLTDKAEKDGKTIQGQVKELIDQFTDFIAAWENDIPEDVKS